MPLITERQLDDNTCLAVWNITEDDDWFKKTLLLNDDEIKVLVSIKNKSRKTHWLASRFLIRKIIKTNDFIDLLNDDYGKPMISNFPFNISISHSGDLAAILISRDFHVGLDIELIREKAVTLAPKFMSDEEINSIEKNVLTEKINLYWSAKEAVYKWYGKKGLEFKKNIIINNFSFSDKGTIEAMISINHYREPLVINYEKLGDYIMTWVLK